jgi:hypothetical protein
MIIDKNKGYWNVGKSPYLDELAYYLYLKDFDNWIHSIGFEKPITQYVFCMQHSYEKNTGHIAQYYNKALSVIRKEKLEKINEKIL